METLEAADDNAPIPTPPLPEQGHDEGDPLRPEIDEENSTPNAYMAKPTQDMEVVEDKEEVDYDDNESALSEVDEAQFEDFNPEDIAIDERPILVDESNVALLGVHKRKRTEGEDGERKKKKKEGRREKPKKRRGRAEEVTHEDGVDGEERRSRRRAAGGERRRPKTPEDEENLTPEERRRRALDRAMDEALRGPNARRGRKKDGIDLDAMADQQIEDLRRRMTEAAQADTIAREKGQPAMHKLKMLPEVVSMLNRNTLRSSLVDPDINLLEAVRFFLEPLNDGSLPAYNIQRDLFEALSKLPINKDALVASGIGKVTLFYTKSKRPEDSIKRMAEKLMTEWTRPILRREDDFRKRQIQEVNFDPNSLPIRSSQTISQAEAQAAARAKALAQPKLHNRARIEGGTKTYTIAPRSNVQATQSASRPINASGEEMLRRLKAKQRAR